MDPSSMCRNIPESITSSDVPNQEDWLGKKRIEELELLNLKVHLGNLVLLDGELDEQGKYNNIFPRMPLQTN